jgi:hypothetical protein
MKNRRSKKLQIIMIHRPFLFLSFQSPLYIHTRQTCISAAITILREHEKITNTDSISIWTHSAFCVTAAIVICLELLYRHTNTYGDARTSHYRELISGARERLARRRGDVMADRGVKLIDTMLHEEDNASRLPGHRPTINFRKVVAEFLALDNPMSVLGIGTVAGTAQAEPGFPMNEDFNAWFSEIFGDVEPLGQALSGESSWT